MISHLYITFHGPHQPSIILISISLISNAYLISYPITSHALQNGVISYDIIMISIRYQVLNSLNVFVHFHTWPIYSHIFTGALYIHMYMPHILTRIHNSHIYAPHIPIYSPYVPYMFRSRFSNPRHLPH